MGFGLAGWKSAVQSVAQTIAQLVGQDIVARSISLSQTTGNNGITLQTTGARFKLSGSGTRDYFFSTGNDASFQGVLTIVNGSILQNQAGGVQLQLQDLTNSKLWQINQTNDAVLWFNNATSNVLTFGTNGRVTTAADLNFTSFSDGSGTTGNQTLNVVRGICAIAAAGTSCVITNSFVTASSTVLAVLQSNDANDTKLKSVVPAGGGGSFTVNLSTAPAATVKIAFVVLN